MAKRLIDPHIVVEFEELADGRLRVPATRAILPSVAESRWQYEAATKLLTGEGLLLNYALDALRRRWSEVVFDEVCGHWLATWRPHLVNEYACMYVRHGERRLNPGFHQVAWLGWRGEIPLVMGRGGKPHRLSVDHLCMLKLCGNPWHLEVKTQAANSRAAADAYRRMEIDAMDQPVISNFLAD